jgi:D-alanyl-D-alanine carboxypeptidase
VPRLATRWLVGCTITLTSLVWPTFALTAAARTTPSPGAADSALDAAVTQLVSSPGAPPGIAVVVQRGGDLRFHTAGAAVAGVPGPPMLDDQMRLASVSKAFSSAVILSLARDRRLSLTDKVGRWLPITLPKAWRAVTLSELLNHTSGIPDFSKQKPFQDAVRASLLSAPPPSALLSYVSNQPLEFKPGSRYQYSNSDNIVAGLVAEAASGHPYDALVQQRVTRPFGLRATNLPRDATLSRPFVHGYAVEAGQPPEDVSEALAAGWSWASGGINSTPADANRFIRAYVRGAETDTAAQSRQFRFVSNSNSEPPGPGSNAAGLGIFRYTTECGTVYGHTGNTLGYTQFVAATRDGSRSVVVTANTQLTPGSNAAQFEALRRIYGLAVCVALART